MIGEHNQGATHKLSAFDDKPIAQQKKFNIPEYAQNEDPNMIPETYNPQPKPLAQRLKKKIVKVKREAVQQLLGLVRQDPQEYKAHESLTVDLIAFNDAIVQDRSLKALVIFLEAGNQISVVDAKTVIKTVIQKCLVVEKEEIKSNSQKVLFEYMDNGSEQILLSELNDNILHKNRKILCVSILFIANLLNNYGIKRMKSLERFTKNLNTLSTPPKPNAKTETILLFKEAFRWMGDLCLGQFKMHPEVKDEVLKFSKQYQKVPMEIKRGLKKQLKKGQKQKPVYYMEEEEQQSKDPVDVLSAYSAQWVDNLLKLQKWKEKKQTLDEFIKKIKVPAILPCREQSHLIHLIKMLLADNNINICYCGFFIIQHLAKGLRRDFAHIARNIVSEVFLKLKQLKAMTVEHAKTTIKSLFNTLTFQDMMENLKDGLKDKSPQMKEQTLKLIALFAKRKDNKTMNLLRVLTDKIIQLTEDGVVKVRNQALDVLIAFKTTFGMKFFGEKVRALDPKKLQTLQLAKPPADYQEQMQIEEATVVVQGFPQVSKEQKTNKLQHSKSMDEARSLASSRVLNKQQNSSINSNGQSKVSRTLNLNFLHQIGNVNENVRATAYQQIANKYLSKDVRQFIKEIKNNSLREASTNILKNVLIIAKKYIHNGIGDSQIAQFVVKHDWKRSKSILTEFLQAHRFSPEAQDLLRTTGVTIQTNRSNMSHCSSTHFSPPFKQFSTELQNSLINKMSSPIEEVKKEAAERAIKIWQQIPKIASESQLNPTNGWQDEPITKFFNIAKHRLTDSSPEIITVYCQLLIQILKKGISAKQKNMKILVHTIFNGLNKSIPAIKDVFREMVESSPSHIFMAMQGQILVEGNQSILIDYLHQHSDLFIKYADLRVFMIPFLHLLCNSSIEMKHKQILDKLFNQLVQISGEEALQRQIGKMKVSNVEPYNQYLSKYHLSLSRNSSSQSASSRNYRLKQNRLQYWEQEGWHFQVTSNHILKLCNIMGTLGEPLSSLCNLFTLTPQNIHDLSTLDLPFLLEHSDIFFKFIYWRSAVDNSQIVSQLLRFTSRLLTAVQSQITQVDVIILMKTFLFILQRFSQNLQGEVGQILSKLFSINKEIQDNTMQFWINYLMNHNPSPPLTHHIISILMNSYSDKLSDNLVQLARIPAIHKDQNFLNLLTSKCHPQVLAASGFRVTLPSNPQTNFREGRQLLTELGGPQNMIQIDSSEVMSLKEMFSQNSQYLLTKLGEISNTLDSYRKVEKYVKIFYSILSPFFSGEIPFINVFEFIKEMVKMTAEPYQFKKTYLRQLTRLLLYTLIDLSDHPPNGNSCQQMIKLINKCVLNILQTSESRHIIEILFLLGKRHLELNVSGKIIHIIFKCINKIYGYAHFSQNLEQNILFLYEQSSSIIQQSNITSASPYYKSFKSIYIDLFKHYPISVALLQPLICKTPLIVIEFLEEYQMSIKKEPEPLGEQPSDTRNLSSALNSIRSMPSAKHTSIKERQEQNI